MKVRQLPWFWTFWLLGVGGAFLLALPFESMMCDAMR
jgi:hypothetical protein